MESLSKAEEARLKFKIGGGVYCARTKEKFYIDKIWIDALSGPKCVLGSRNDRRYLYYGGKWAKSEK